MLNQRLIEEFHKEVIRLCDVTKRETSYNPKGFKGKAQRVGAYEATKDILNSTSDNWNGFTELILNTRLDLSLEVLVLNNKWQPLFTKDQLLNAQRRLRQVDYSEIPDIIQTEETEGPKEELATRRKEYTVNSIVRDSKLAKEIKEMYDFKCQVCGIGLIALDQKYAEAAHVRPLGDPHNGRDEIENIMCLCPNHHKLFDLGGFFVDADYKISNSGEKLHVDKRHTLDMKNFKYHRGWFENNA